MYLKELKSMIHDLQKSYQLLLSISDEGRQEKLFAFKQIIDQLYFIHDEIFKEQSKREELIHFHCQTGNMITIENHEQYHQNMESLIFNIDTFFSSYKTCLNLFSILITSFFSQQEVRGLRSGSINKMLNSIDDVITDDDEIKAILLSLSTHGDEINQIIEYRDKHIEHSKNLVPKTINSKANGEIQIIKSTGRRKIEDNKDVIITLEKGIYHQPTRVQSSNNQYIVYFHIYQEFKGGEEVQIGDELGLTFDNTVDHFKKYGPHIHIFSSEGFVNDKIPLCEIPGDLIITSPDPHDSLLKLISLINQIFSQLIKGLS